MLLVLMKISKFQIPMKMKAMEMLGTKSRSFFFFLDLDLETISSPRCRQMVPKLDLDVVGKFQKLNIMTMIK